MLISEIFANSQTLIERAVILSHGDRLQVPIAKLSESHSQVFARAATFEQAERNEIIGKIPGRTDLPLTATGEPELSTRIFILG